ncbi:MAG: thermonuclease family protein [Ginsengibacter sp.]
MLTKDTVKIRVRLHGIDCPERRQDYYQICKDALSGYIFGKNVSLVTHGKDRWKRTIAEVYLGTENINLKMVRNGYAWHYIKYSKDQKLAEAEAEARKHRRGLWNMKDPLPPWNHRKPVKKKSE